MLSRRVRPGAAGGPNQTGQDGGLHGRDERDFVGRPAPGLCAVALTAEVGVVDLDPPSAGAKLAARGTAAGWADEAGYRRPSASAAGASGHLVTFEPGGRSAWHTHTKGQWLVVVSGVGFTQEWVKSVQELRPGDVA